jgi:hypothetical protein
VPTEFGAPRRGQRLDAVCGGDFLGQAAGDFAAQPPGQLVVVPAAGQGRILLAYVV